MIFQHHANQLIGLSSYPLLKKKFTFLYSNTKAMSLPISDWRIRILHYNRITQKSKVMINTFKSMIRLSLRLIKKYGKSGAPSQDLIWLRNFRWVGWRLGRLLPFWLKKECLKDGSRKWLPYYQHARSRKNARNTTSFTEIMKSRKAGTF